MNILFIGATSDIAKEMARIYASKNARLFLIARNKENLTLLKSDLLSRGAQEIGIAVADLNNFEGHTELCKEGFSFLNSIDLAVIAHGTLSDPNKCENFYTEAINEIKSNFLSQVSLLTCLANLFALQKKGKIAVISSIAGDRGKQSNYVYCSAKGGLNVFLEGLRCRLFKIGVDVVTIKPGFVSTKMTAHLPQNFLFSTPQNIAKDIITKINRGTIVIYTPSYWKWIVLIFRCIPERIFRRLSI